MSFIMGTKYKWSMRRHWKAWLIRDYKRFWYKLRYGYDLGNIDGGHIPITGETKFCSTKVKGQIIEIKQKHVDGIKDHYYDEVRIIPWRDNHGVFIERYKDGKLRDRNILGLGQFNKDIIFASNVEQLSGRK